MQRLTDDTRYRDWSNLTTHALWCYDGSLYSRASGEVYRSRGYVNNSAWLIREGWAEVEHDGKVVRAGPGEWLIAKPTAREQRFQRNVQLLSLAFEARWPNGDPWIHKGLSLTLPAERFPRLEQRAKPMVRILKRVNPDSWVVRDSPIGPAEFLRLESYLSSWLEALVTALSDVGIDVDHRSGVDPRVLQAVRLIRALPWHVSLSRETVAHQAGLSLPHLERLVKQHIGCSLAAYHTRLRVEYAQSRLRVSGTLVKEVAYELGFHHQSQFCNWFKARTGISPRGYQRNAPILGRPQKHGGGTT